MYGKRFKRFFCRQYEKIWFYGYVYVFSVDYDSIGVDEILDIHKYLMQKHDIKWCLDLLKNGFFTAMNFF